MFNFYIFKMIHICIARTLIDFFSVIWLNKHKSEIVIWMIWIRVILFGRFLWPMSNCTINATIFSFLTFPKQSENLKLKRGIKRSVSTLKFVPTAAMSDVRQ